MTGGTPLLVVALLLASPSALAAATQQQQQQQPSFTYKYTSFAVPAPSAAASFAATYLGGRRLSESEFLTHRDRRKVGAVVEGVRFAYASGTKSHDVYFVHDPKASAGGWLTPDELASQVHATHRFDVQETWDWFQDWHLCLHVDDVDLIAYRLVRDNIPIVTRSSYSFYVEIPGSSGITFQILGSKMRLVWSELFNFCRNTTADASGAALAPTGSLVIGDFPEPLPPIPELAPAHHSYFASDPVKALNWTARFTSATPFDMGTVWQESHRYSDGRCALIQWLDFANQPGAKDASSSTFQIHFIRQDRKKEGRGGLKVRDIEGNLTALHGDMSATNAFFDYRVGWELPRGGLQSVKHALTDAGMKFYEGSGGRRGDDGVELHQQQRHRDSIFVQVPGGIIWELSEAEE